MLNQTPEPIQRYQQHSNFSPLGINYMNQMTSFNFKSLSIYLTILDMIYLFIDAFAHIIHTWSNQLRPDSIILTTTRTTPTISQMISSYTVL